MIRFSQKSNQISLKESQWWQKIFFLLLLLPHLSISPCVKNGNKTFKLICLFWGEEMCCFLTYEETTSFPRSRSLPHPLHLIITTWRCIIFRLSNENISFKSLKYSSLIITQNYGSLNYVSISRESAKVCILAPKRPQPIKFFAIKNP